ncbi:FtsB family cell division protein [Pseudochrobactrum sp. MP213Fo]|uniref:FtsB family cell division protein n=1 Tax=Pseudochrobactrum sp. MP213Fo TaxID=3022250 RepID=UPI003BA0FACE
MWTKQKRKTIRGRFIVPLLATAFLSYFGFHAYNGAYGIYSKEQLQAQATSLSQQLADLSEQRVSLERQVSQLRDGSIDKDILDEQARRALNLSHADEVTIIVTRGNKAN